jgi:hypothetical protein
LEQFFQSPHSHRRHFCSSDIAVCPRKDLSEDNAEIFRYITTFGYIHALIIEMPSATTAE